MVKHNKVSAIDKLKNDINSEYIRWQDCFANGCNDPFWTDGANLNLIRNHILSDLNKIKEISQAPYQCVVPPLLPDGYMVKSGKYFKHRYNNLKLFSRLVYSSNAEQIQLF